jgi:hypothetical protein
LAVIKKTEVTPAQATGAALRENRMGSSGKLTGAPTLSPATPLPDIHPKETEETLASPCAEQHHSLWSSYGSNRKPIKHWKYYISMPIQCNITQS